MRVTPRKCRPIAMMAITGEVGGDADYTPDDRPVTQAVTPSATNTVEKPSTNSTAASTVSRLTRGSGSLSAKRSSEVPARNTRSAVPGAGRRGRGS